MSLMEMMLSGSFKIMKSAVKGTVNVASDVIKAAQEAKAKEHKAEMMAYEKAILKKIQKMSNKELAQKIREESDEQIKKILVAEFLDRGNDYSELDDFRQAILKRAGKMNNAELAQAIREEDDKKVKEIFTEVFLKRGNAKKDIYNF